MNSPNRPQTLNAVGRHILEGGEPGFEIKDFLHEFKDSGNMGMLSEPPPKLELQVRDGKRLDAFLQALAVYLAVRLDYDPPGWTTDPIAGSLVCIAGNSYSELSPDKQSCTFSTSQPFHRRGFSAGGVKRRIVHLGGDGRCHRLQRAISIDVPKAQTNLPLVANCIVDCNI